MPTTPPTFIEAFVMDRAFIDQTKSINGFLLEEVGKVGALTPKALTYFNTPAQFQDSRVPSTREINWAPETAPAVIVDEDTYSGFVETVNNLTVPVSTGFFKLVDKLLFNYDSNVTHPTLEAALLADTDIADIYVAGSFILSATILTDDIYHSDGTVVSADVPTFVTFSLILPSGSTTITYTITLFTSVDAWLVGYNTSTIVKVVPPLPYDQLYSASLINNTANVFSTAAMSATLSYNTTRVLMGSVSVSGITEYLGVLVDVSDNTAAAPFNILYKGRSPTLSEVRQAIRDALAASGVGTLEGWQARIPGVYISGRFYVIPFWDLTYEKPDQVIFPSINHYKTLAEKSNQILDSTAFGDISEYIDIFPAYYNRMTMASVPDLTGVVDVVQLNTLIPDYQNFSSDDENFAYMLTNTQIFADKLNQILAIDSTDAVSNDFVTITENLLTFRSFVIGRYEICVITKVCYNTIMESIQ